MKICFFVQRKFYKKKHIHSKKYSLVNKFVKNLVVKKVFGEKVVWWKSSRENFVSIIFFGQKRCLIKKNKKNIFVKTFLVKKGFWLKLSKLSLLSLLSLMSLLSLVSKVTTLNITTVKCQKLILISCKGHFSQASYNRLTDRRTDN